MEEAPGGCLAFLYGPLRGLPETPLLTAAEASLLTASQLVPEAITKFRKWNSLVFLFVFFKALAPETTTESFQPYAIGQAVKEPEFKEKRT